MGKGRTYLIVGPSGIGKSTICNNLERLLPTYQHLDLDLAADVRKDGYIERGMQIISDLEQSTDSNVYLVDIGAGFQNQPIFQEFLKTRSTNLLCILTDPEIAYECKKSRADGDWRSLEEYIQDEYAEHRQLIYQLGTVFHNLNMDNTFNAIAAHLSN